MFDVKITYIRANCSVLNNLVGTMAVERMKCPYCGSENLKLWKHAILQITPRADAKNAKNAKNVSQPTSMWKQ